MTYAQGLDHLELLASPVFESLPVPVTLPGSQFVQVSAGSGHLCALEASGQPICWGDNYNRELSGPLTDATGASAVALTGVLQVVAGDAHSCARLDLPCDQENVYCWGNNQYGQLGVAYDHAAQDPGVPTPAVVHGVRGAIEIETLTNRTCARDGAGTITCWGGDPSAFSPTAVTGVQGAIAMAVGDPGSSQPNLAFLDAGGMAQQAQFDLASSTWSVSPLSEFPAPASQISMGHDLCVVDRAKPSLAHCEFVEDGLTMTTFDAQFPAEVAQIATGRTRYRSQADILCASLVDHTVRCLGDDIEGVLGIGAPDLVRAPTRVDLGGLQPAAVFVTAQSTIVQMTDNSVVAFGTSGLLFGNGNLNTPQPPAGLQNFQSPITWLSSNLGEDHLYALAGTDQRYLSTTVPTPASDLLSLGLGTFSQAFASDSFDLGMAANGAVIFPFDNKLPTVAPPGSSGGMPASISGVMAGSVLASFPSQSYDRPQACALAGGAVSCWGGNNNGEVSPGTAPKAVWPPVAISFGNVAPAATSICTGYSFSCAALGNGDVECWGLDNWFQTDPDGNTIANTVLPAPTKVTNLDSAQLTCGADWGCAWNPTSAVCWGTNDHGAIGDPNLGFVFGTGPFAIPIPAGFSQILSMSAGPDHACFVVGNGSASSPASALYCWGSNEYGAVGAMPTAIFTTPQQVCALDP
jgi:hypothetical protein